jgi:hypothetical protein
MRGVERPRLVVGGLGGGAGEEEVGGGVRIPMPNRGETGVMDNGSEEEVVEAAREGTTRRLGATPRRGAGESTLATS